LTVLKNDKELDDEGHGLDFEVCEAILLAYWLKKVKARTKKSFVTSQNMFHLQDLDFKTRFFQMPLA
jgi:hypothetical protein